MFPYQHYHHQQPQQQQQQQQPPQQYYGGYAPMMMGMPAHQLYGQPSMVVVPQQQQKKTVKAGHYGRWTLARRVRGKMQASDLKLVEEPIPTAADLEDGEALVAVVLLSVDPTQRIWAGDEVQYMEPCQLGETFRGLGLGRVVASKGDAFAPGDYVSGILGLTEYAIVAATPGHPAAPQKVHRIPDQPLAVHMAVFGLPGASAVHGCRNAEPKVGETAVISTAAGSVGSIAGQYLKAQGLRVVGLTSTDAKCEWLTKELGFDAAINYKTAGAALKDKIADACPDGVDVYFENVGGAIAAAVMANMNLFGRVSVCGMISHYDNEADRGALGEYKMVLHRRLTVRGFIVSDSAAEWGTFFEELHALLADGRLRYRAEIPDNTSIVDVPARLADLFASRNMGKALVRLRDDDVPFEQ